jgi:hypothetical protein
MKRYSIRDETIARLQAADWSRSNMALARAYHMSRDTVAACRAELAPGTRRHPGQHDAAADYGTVDWTLEDSTIGVLLGRHRTAVRAIRLRLPADIRAAIAAARARRRSDMVALRRLVRGHLGAPASR